MDGTRAFVDRLTSWSPVLLLGCLAALTYWLDAQVQPSPAHRDGSSRHDPDLFLVDFRAVNFDANGKPIESLSAVRGDHYPDDDSVALTKPNFKMTQPDKPAFSIDADRGTVSGDRENVFFNGNVRAHREAESGTAVQDHDPSGPITLETDYLHIVPKTEHADTDRAVTIREPRGIIEGVGLELDNKTKTAKLRSHVSGTFQPQAIKK